MLYLWIKFVHILSSTILFGTGIGTASIFFYAHRTRDTHIIAAVLKYVVIADWAFTTTSAIVQPITGLVMVYLAGYSLLSFWLLASIIGYVIAALCWLPVVYLQIKMRDDAIFAYQHQTPLPIRFHRYFKYWFLLGWPAFLSLIIVFYLMTNKP